MATFSAAPWTYYSFSYTATKTNPILQFAFNNGGSTTYLDDVSVANIVSNTTQLLTNPSFESSTSLPPVGWATWCTSTCLSGTAGKIVTNSSACYNSSGSSCFVNQCTAGYQFLAQEFAAVANQIYIVSFWLRITSGTTIQFYVDII